MFLLLFFLLVLCSDSARASNEVKVATETGPLPISMSYFGVGRMNGILDPESYSTKVKAGPTSMNQFFFNYRVYKTYYVGTVLGFDFQPRMIGETAFFNPALRLGDTEMIATSHVKLLSDIRIFLPIDEESRKLQVSFSILTTQILTVRIPQTHFFFNSFTQLGMNSFNQLGKGKRIQFFTRASLNYELNDTIGVNWVTTLNLSQKNQNDSSFLDIDALRAGPGLFWKPNSNVNLNPHLLFDTRKGIVHDPALVLLATIRFF